MPFKKFPTKKKIKLNFWFTNKRELIFFLILTITFLPTIIKKIKYVNLIFIIDSLIKKRKKNKGLRMEVIKYKTNFFMQLIRRDFFL